MCRDHLDADDARQGQAALAARSKTPQMMQTVAPAGQQADHGRLVQHVDHVAAGEKRVVLSDSAIMIATSATTMP